MGIAGHPLRPVDLGADGDHPRHDLGLLQRPVARSPAGCSCSATRRASCAAGSSRRSRSPATSSFLDRDRPGRPGRHHRRPDPRHRLVPRPRPRRPRATALMPGLGRPAAEWRRAMSALRRTRGRAGRCPVAVRGDRRSPTSTAWPGTCRPCPGSSAEQRRALLAAATVRDVPAGATIVGVGETSAMPPTSSSTAERRPGRPMPTAAYRSLSSMARRRLLRRDRGPDRQPPDGDGRGRGADDGRRGPGRQPSRC